MDAIIVVAISAIGYFFCDIDFCALFTLINVAISLYKDWTSYTNDKTAKR